MPKRKSLIGKKFARLTVIGEGTPCKCSGRNFRRSVCKCECGNITDVLNSHLVQGSTKSCGCFRIENTRRMKLKHGHSVGRKESPTYKCWSHMLARCNRTKAVNFKYYGGRGISVCDRWMIFENFLSDMGERPKGLQLDRIDNSKGYEPGNVRWATRIVQAQNKRNNRYFTVGGIHGCLAELCRIFGVPEPRTRYRLNHGWDINKAFTKLHCATHED